MIYTKRTFDLEVPLEEADTVLVGIPFDSTETGRPVRYGPLFIREALKGLPGLDTKFKINPFAKLKLSDVGDVEVVPGSWELTKERIVQTTKEILETNKNILPVFLGGEHLITLGILEALAKLYGKITVIDFDAHADLAKDWMGNKFSHITWAWHAKKIGIDLVQIGVRSWTEYEEKLIKISENLKFSGPVYITIDLDVIDPSVAQDVGTPEPNGLSQEKFFKMLEQALQNKIIGIDIVECAAQGLGTNTALIAAEIIKKALCYRIR